MTVQCFSLMRTAQNQATHPKHLTSLFSQNLNNLGLVLQSIKGLFSFYSGSILLSKLVCGESSFMVPGTHAMHSLYCKDLLACSSLAAYNI